MNNTENETFLVFWVFLVFNAINSCCEDRHFLSVFFSNVLIRNREGFSEWKVCHYYYVLVSSEGHGESPVHPVCGYCWQSCAVGLKSLVKSPLNSCGSLFSSSASEVPEPSLKINVQKYGSK